MVILTLNLLFILSIFLCSIMIDIDNILGDIR